jgi:AcrR family transcriptional regulator
MSSTRVLVIVVMPPPLARRSVGSPNNVRTFAHRSAIVKGVSTEVRPDRRRARHEATRQEIVDAAWEIVRAEGLAALTMRGLARAVGMEPQSLYTYVASKHDVYDALFADGNEELLRRFEATPMPTEPRAILRTVAQVMFTFDAEDAARSQLMFQRTIPDFTPSDESYALAEAVWAYGVQCLAQAGITDPTDMDLYTAVVAGLGLQQLANDPGGDRWERLLDRAIDMYVREVLS